MVVSKEDAERRESERDRVVATYGWNSRRICGKGPFELNMWLCYAQLVENAALLILSSYVQVCT